VQGLKPGAFKLWVNWIQLVQPHRVHGGELILDNLPLLIVERLGVAAVQVAFESKGLKPGYHILSARVETRRLQATGQLESTCTAPTAV
jgi:hypothetical protein